MQNLAQHIKNYPASKYLENKVILVTGASNGIGARAAVKFAEFGATVILLGRNIKKLEKIYDEIKSQQSPEPAIYPLDLQGASRKDYIDMASSIESQLGRLDGILHNAAILGETSPFQYYDPDEWSRILQINLTAPFLLTQSCIPLLKKSDCARIIFTTHKVSKAYWGAYGVSKAGVENFMLSLADELESQSIQVNAICPGDVQSPIISRAYPGKNINTLPTIESIMPTYLYLIGPDSNNIHGQIFVDNLKNYNAE